MGMGYNRAHIFPDLMEERCTWDPGTGIRVISRGMSNAIAIGAHGATAHIKALSSHGRFLLPIREPPEK